MPSFDMVSEVESTEIRNATENSLRELATRFDFRGVKASIDMQDDVITVSAEADFQCRQMLDIVSNNIVKRNIDPNSISADEDCTHTGKVFSLAIRFKQGIDQPTAKKIVKLIKAAKTKVQVAIQGDKIRVTGKKRDDLQGAMALVREADLGQAFQFNNFRD
ncbi:MAG: YajQ family cyclic di-GMP-binding protein [Gammaproteobacteria bacterium]|nr:YajQ family cyclic di-GMP-binding protein [Gammaproteobacteria bacterium]MBQ0838563.1 YajQ family cyclic di-GMP-binding protein [Gammaproteobacteria bacterium]